MTNSVKSLFIAVFSAISLSAAADVTWYDGSNAVSYQVEGKAAPVVQQALRLFEGDMELVTGKKAVASKNAVIRIVQGKGSDDGFCISVKDGRIIIEGHNARGAAYGLLELSRMAGVSPWVWWGDVRPHSQNKLSLPDTFRVEHTPSVQYRGIFINDEDWSLRKWSQDDMGPQTYKRLFELMLRLRANIIWPAMHDVSPGFFTVKGNKEMADSFGILIGTSHCEPLLRNNVAEWDVKARGAYNYITNREEVKKYWAERLKQVKGSEEFFTIGMRGIHDGSMEGVKTPEEKLNGLQQVIDDQRELIKKYYSKDVEKVPQVFIPYKEVLEIYESGLRVPDDVTLMWCDDNYGYLTRLPDAEQQKRKGGGGVYYHLSYWGRPHDYLWLTTTQPGLIYTEMKAAYDHNCRKLWIANVHDPKVAAYDLEFFLDMAWDIDAITPSTIGKHLERWLVTQFGAEVGCAIAPAMRELYRLNGIRRPEFMGWTQVELDKKKYPGGKSVPTTTEFTRKQAFERMNDFARIEATVDVYAQMIPDYLQDAYFAHVLYPVHASAAMTRKMLSNGMDYLKHGKDYNLIQMLTEAYNTMNNGKWKGLMSAAPRDLPVFAPDVHTELPQHPSGGPCIARNACQYDSSTSPCTVIDMLGHSMQAVALAKGNTLTYEFESPVEGDAVLRTAMIPTQPSDKGDLRYEVRIDDQAPVVISLKEPYRSEQWKKNVLRCQALKKTPIRLTKGSHKLYIKALDDHIIVDQWMVDFNKEREFYVIPIK
ncbi:MAG: glycosyl hydrolase 115 family protein [Prevotella sp.]|nr:glycosyl hydrolase 115 family protein [Prevotella sp.]